MERSSHDPKSEPLNKQTRGSILNASSTSNVDSGIAKESSVSIKAPPPPVLPPLPYPSTSSSSSPTSASMSQDYFESSPTPPRSLEDQVHIAYALDNIHLAKVLLLKLKGIEVTSDDDPRIAAVQDEDFDLCFFPHGKLMDEADEKALFEQQRQEMEKLEERRREDRLRACERLWEQEKERLREARAAAMRQREEEEKRQAEEETRIKVAKEKEAAARKTRLNKSMSSRNMVSYERLGRLRAGSSHASPPFVYEFMTLTSPTTAKQRQSSQSISQTPSQPFTRPTYDESRTVPFSDVLASMQGPLFPVERCATTPSQDPRKQRQNELLDSLLKVVEWEVNERRKLKGKWTERPVLRRTGSDKSIPSCVACSISSPSISSSFQSSRCSWLSFSSAPSSSTSTAVTTPSASPPRSSWFSKPTVSSSLVATAQKRPTSLIIFNPPIPPHSCQSFSRFTPVPLAECPLTLSEPSSSSAGAFFKPSSITERTVKPSSDRVMRRVSRLVEFAKEFQNAYVNATLFAVMATSDSFEVRTVNAVSVASFPGCQSGTPQPSRCKPKRTGYRARANDVALFLNMSPTDSNRCRSEGQTIHGPSIPLKLWRPVSDSPHTILPNPLPYPLRFKPLPKPCRSPFSLHGHLVIPLRRHSPSPAPWTTDLLDEKGLGAGAITNGTVTWRTRTVENPMYLRLKALQNVLWEERVDWQGRAREGSMGAGREKVVRVTFEGVGRSLLSGSAEFGCW